MKYMNIINQISKKIILCAGIWFFGMAHANEFDASTLANTLKQHEFVSGQFEQKRFPSGSNHALTVRGKFALWRGKGLVWHTQQPFENLLRIRPDGLARFSNGQWVTSGREQEKQMALFLNILDAKTAALEKQFTIDISGSNSSWLMILHPRTTLMKQIFTEIRITGGNGFVYNVTLNEAQGDKTQMKFTNTHTNRLPESIKTALE